VSNQVGDGKRRESPELFIAVFVSFAAIFALVRLLFPDSPSPIS